MSNSFKNLYNEAFKPIETLLVRQALMTKLDFYVKEDVYESEEKQGKPSELDARFISERTLKHIISKTLDKSSTNAPPRPTVHEIYQVTRKHIFRVRRIADFLLIDVDEHRLLPSYGSEGDIPDQVHNLFNNEHKEIMEYSEEKLTEVDKLLLRRKKRTSQLALKVMNQCTRLAKATREWLKLSNTAWVAEANEPC